MPGDQITHIDGEPTEPILMDEVLNRLRGPSGTNVTITILRGANLIFDQVITRAQIEVPTVKRDMLPGNIAYLRIIEFTPHTAARTKDALEWFKSQRYSSLIIDLRNNPGGLLESSVQVADIFLTEGLIVSTKARKESGNPNFYATKNSFIQEDIPLIVLINRGSASASEILAGALKDHKRAYLVGEKTYGKGSVQQVLTLGKTGFKLTMSQYFTPSDANINKLGIPPDFEVKEPRFTEEEEISLSELIEKDVFATFAKANPRASAKQIDDFVLGLKSPVSSRILKKMVRNQLERTSIAPVYDLDFDLQLNAAISIIKQSDFAKLLAASKTVSELQEIAATSGDLED
jgi:carboxyl-terminal processing protease